MAKYNWETIKKQYIQGIRDGEGNKDYPSQPDLCKTHGCSASAIGTRASKEDWKGEREKYQRKIERKLSEKKSEKEAEDIFNSDEDFEKTGESLRELADRQIKLANKKLDTYENLTKEDPEHPDAWKYWVRGSETKNISELAQNAQNMVKVAQGEVSKVVGVKVEEVDDEEEKKLLEEFADYIARQD